MLKKIGDTRAKVSSQTIATGAAIGYYTKMNGAFLGLIGTMAFLTDNAEVVRHIVSYENLVDEIVIKHKAHNREGFALGAIVAAEWLIGKKGVFTMKDVLNLG